MPVHTKKNPATKTSSTVKKLSKQPKEKSANGELSKEVKPSPSKLKSEHTREILYPSVSVKLFSTESPLTVAVAKKLLGWQIESENIKFKSDFLFKDLDGNKVRCFNNFKNRPLYPILIQKYIQVILKKQWMLNGEPIIVGRTGILLDGQHTLVALVLAAQTVSTFPGKWREFWEIEPFIEKVVVFGIGEDDTTANSINNGKPRSFADVLYRTDLLSKIKPKHRKLMARSCEYAVKLLWHRTGASVNAFASIRTHQESMDFIDRHPKILDCVRHIYEENGSENSISKYISLGAATGLLYLMGSCSSSPEEYLAADSQNESSLDWSNWDKACEFWVLLAQNEKRVNTVRKSLGYIIDAGGGSLAERCGLLVQAWIAFLDSGKITEADLKLEYTTDDSDIRKLVEIPTLGGIDFGSPELKQEAIGGVVEDHDKPKSKSRKTKTTTTTESSPKPKSIKSKPHKTSMAGDDWSADDYCWVIPTDDTEPYFARVIGEPFDGPNGNQILVEEDGNEWLVATNLLSLEAP